MKRDKRRYVATVEQREKWSRMMNDPALSTMAQLNASELLGRSEGDFDRSESPPFLERVRRWRKEIDEAEAKRRLKLQAIRGKR